MKPACGVRTAWILTTGGIALGVSGLAAVATLAKYWGSNSENADRFLILVAVGWLMWRLRSELPNSRGSIAGYVPLIIGCSAPIPAWYLYGQVGPKVILIWWLAGAWVLAAAGAALLLGGWSWLRLFAFPLAFLLLAVPLPERIELPIQHELKKATTSLAEAGLRASGMTVSRQGFELYLPSGGLEVVEACSGVRSVTALLAIAVFVSHLRGFGLLRGLLMLGLALPVVAAVNALRVILTGWIQEGFGQEMIQGTPHEILGVIMVLAGLGLVVLLSQLLRPRRVNVGISNPMPLLFPRVPAAWLAALIAVLGMGGSAYAYLAGYARVAHLAEAAPLEKIPLVIGDWKGEEKEIDEKFRKALSYDNAIFRVYRDQPGHEIGVWVIFWDASSSIYGYHHPDVCFPARGFVGTPKPSQILDLGDGRELKVIIRHFTRGPETKIVTYWTQEGKKVFSDDDEATVDKDGPGHHWVKDRLVEHPPEMSSRLSVLIVTDQVGSVDRVEKMMNEFARQLAQHVFEACPWADMKRPGE
jgi:EpsI family protein